MKRLVHEFLNSNVFCFLNVTRVQMFEHWCQFVPMEVREKHLERQVEHKFFLRQVAFQISLLRRWQKVSGVSNIVFVNLVILFDVF